MSSVYEDLELYNFFKKKAAYAFDRNKFEESLDYIRAAALLAWQCHCGLWYDSELENLLKDIGNCLKDKINFNNGKRPFSAKKVVYITSAVNVGGLTVLLNHWISLLRNDFEERIVYVTNHYTSKNSFYGSDTTFSDPELKVYNLNHKKRYVDRIKELIKILNDISPDFIILFIDPDDVIAVSAVGALDVNSKVIYVNHTDHAFWLGRNVVGTLACFRMEGAVHARQCRNIMNSCVIPISTNIKPDKAFREDFNITDGSTVSLSVGTFPKVLGDKNPSYFSTITRLLEQFPDHYHFFITNPPDKLVLENYLPEDPDIRRRFVIDGPFSNLAPYYGMADFLIETFPITGYTVQVEAMTFKLPIVAFKNKFLLFSSAGNMSSYPFSASTEDEIIDFSSKLIESPVLRNKLGNSLYGYYIEKLNPEQTYGLLKDMLDGKTQELDMDNLKNSFNCNAEEVRMFTSKGFSPYKHLILQSVLKESSFSIRRRFDFYWNSLKRKEFASKKEMMGYLIHVIFGKHIKGC